MNKQILEMEQFIAGALLVGFNRLSKLDLEILIEIFERENPDFEIRKANHEIIELDALAPYVYTDANAVFFKDNIDLLYFDAEHEYLVKDRLIQVAESVISSHFENYDLEEFVLRKIKRFSSSGLFAEELELLFGKKELEIIEKSKEKHYLSYSWEGDTICDESKMVFLSEKGEVRLFKGDHSKEIERFTKELEALRYDVTLLDDFLLKQDLSLPIWSVLNVDKLEEFCNEYDRAITIEGVSFVDFERLKKGKETIFDEESKEKISSLLSVWDDGHCIHICHPNHIFAGAKLLNQDVRQIKNLNWDDIDITKMFYAYDYGTFILPDYKDAFKYVHKRLAHDLLPQLKSGTPEAAVSYLTVVEKYRFNSENYYLVRGIIKGDSRGYSIAINPEYKKALPQSTWEKQMRFGGNEVPKIYCKRRKNTV